MPASYPPIFPLLLAPVYARFGLNYVALKFVPELMFVLAAIALYVLGRLRGLAPLPAVLPAGALGLSGIVLGIKDAVLSDSTYLFFGGLALVALVYIYQKRWDESRPGRAAAAASGLMLLAYGTRAIGLSLITAFILYEACLKRRLRRFNIFVLAAFAVGVLLILRIYDTRSYANQFVVAPMAYLHNAVLYVRAPAALWAGSPAFLRYALFAITLIIFTATWIRHLLTRPSIVEFYAITVVLPLILYSAGHSDRYLMPLFPIYLLYFVEGVVDLQNRLLPKTRWAVLAAGLLLAMGAVANVIGMQKGAYQEGVEQPSFRQVSDFLQRSDKSGVVVSWNPRVLALYTDQPSAWYPFVPQDEVFDEYLNRVHARYILVYLRNEDDRQWLLPHIEHQRDLFPSVFHNRDFVVYTVDGYVIDHAQEKRPDSVRPAHE